MVEWSEYGNSLDYYAWAEIIRRSEQLSRELRWWRELFSVPLAKLPVKRLVRWLLWRVWYHRKSEPRWRSGRWKAKT